MDLVRLVHTTLVTVSCFAMAVKLFLTPGSVLTVVYTPETVAAFASNPASPSLFVLLGFMYASWAMMSYMLRDQVVFNQKVAKPVNMGYLLLVLGHIAWFMLSRAAGLVIETNGDIIMLTVVALALAVGAVVLIVFPPPLKPIDDDGDDDDSPSHPSSGRPKSD